LVKPIGKYWPRDQRASVIGKQGVGELRKRLKTKPILPWEKKGKGGEEQTTVREARQGKAFKMGGKEKRLTSVKLSNTENPQNRNILRLNDGAWEDTDTSRRNRRRPGRMWRKNRTQKRPEGIGKSFRWPIREWGQGRVVWLTWGRLAVVNRRLAGVLK